jgi:hypothetical protein
MTKDNEFSQKFNELLLDIKNDINEQIRKEDYKYICPVFVHILEIVSSNKTIGEDFDEIFKYNHSQFL